MIRAVLFDAAGTLIAPREPIGSTYARVAAEHGVSLPASRLDEAFRRVHASAPPMAFPDAPRHQIEDRERAWWRERVRGTFRAADGTARFDDFEAYFDALWETFASADAWSACPDSHAVLTELRARGVATGVISNFDRRLHGLLRELGLSALLDVVVLPSDAGATKPDARIFALALERLGVPARAAIYVGDDPERDVAAARAAGLSAILVEDPATLAELPSRLFALSAADGA